jgi:signal transduction histidine kinase/AmiR/NasT family two-component response regulator
MTSSRPTRMRSKGWGGFWPARLQHQRDQFVVGVLSLALLGALLAVFISSSALGRLMSQVFSGFIFVLLLAFIRGLPEKTAIYIAALLGLAYLFVVSLTEGHLYSSTLAWAPLIPLAIFYVVDPRAGRLWMWVAIGLQVSMAAVAWTWGDQFESMNVAELPVMSLLDYFLVTLTLFMVPSFYQKELETHLQVTQNRQLELQAKQRELVTMLQMREHFIATISHELRTPMNAILGLNAALLERVQDRPHALKVLDYTRQSADHLMTVINDVLDYSQFSSGQITAQVERFALQETVQVAFELFQPKITSTRLRYLCEVQPDVPQWVETDKHRLMQVLVNLLGNAIKFTHQGQVLLRVAVCAQGLEFSVQDTGIGIAQSQQNKIFERFSQADPSIQGRFGGSGLGLTISQQLVRILGGELQMESQEGVGSRFWFRLPLKALSAPTAVTPALLADLAGAQKALRFLVVDDHPVNRLLVRLLLQRQWPHAQVIDVEDGALALRALDAEPGFDLVILDMVMPVMDGIETMRAIRASAHARIRETPVLGLTANVSSVDLARFQQAGLDGMLLKPFEVERLRSEVDRLTAQHRREAR